MSKSKPAKYKITDTNIDKNIIGKQVTVEKVKTKGGPGGDGGRKPGSKNRMTLDKLAKIVTDGFAEQAKFNKQQLEFNTRIEKQVSNLRSDVNTLKTNLNRVIKLNNLKH